MNVTLASPSAQSPEYREAKPEYRWVRTGDGSFMTVGFITRTSHPSTAIAADVTGDGEFVAIHGLSPRRSGLVRFGHR